MAWRQVDLGELWRTRRWRKLLNLIDGLPRNSAYIEAVSEDEELAERMLDDPPAGGDSNPAVRMSEWSPEREALSDIVDRLGGVVQAVIAAAGAKPRSIKPSPRPVTAAMRLRRRRRTEAHRSLVARVLPRHNRS